MITSNNPSDPKRIIALGASNLVRGLHPIVSASRARWGSDVEIVAALGHGRSYGVSSRMLVRTLPGILESGIWRALEELPPVPARALITDVGNDILYGVSPPQILEWIEACLERLQPMTRDIVLAGLPLDSIRCLSPKKFLFFRTLFFPPCRLTLPQAIDICEQVDAGLRRLADLRGVQFFPLKPQWYGSDPIHIHRRFWRAAWEEMLSGESNGQAPASGWKREALQMYFLRPERQWLLRKEQITSQSGRLFPKGGIVRLY